MKQARDSRNFGGRRLHQLKTVGNMIGTLFVRSYERGERVYAAMLARGFDGEVRTLRALSFSWADAYFSVVFFLALIISVILWW
jgi:cobalt/nickel transport system permease protein